MKHAVANAGLCFFTLVVIEAYFAFIHPAGPLIIQINKYFGPELPSVIFTLAFDLVLALVVFFYVYNEQTEEHDAMD